MKDSNEYSLRTFILAAFLICFIASLLGWFCFYMLFDAPKSVFKFMFWGTFLLSIMDRIREILGERKRNRPR